MRAIAEEAEPEPVLSVSVRQCQQLPLWTRRAQTGSQIRKLCRGNVASGRLTCNQRKVASAQGGYSIASAFVWSLLKPGGMCLPPRRNRRLPRKFHFCKRHWKSRVTARTIRTLLSSLRPSLSPAFILQLIVFTRHYACSYLPWTVY